MMLLSPTCLMKYHNLDCMNAVQNMPLVTLSKMWKFEQGAASDSFLQIHVVSTLRVHILPWQQHDEFIQTLLQIS